jgi:hypothetical protein|eukprot:COSAG06_NODE_658_length_13322_cov_3.396430_7_plen_106_part_00
MEFYEQGKRLATSESYQKLTDEQTSKQTSIVVNCRNNMAQVYTKQGMTKEAREQLEEVSRSQLSPVHCCAQMHSRLPTWHWRRSDDSHLLTVPGWHVFLAGGNRC